MEISRQNMQIAAAGTGTAVGAIAVNEAVKSARGKKAASQVGDKASRMAAGTKEKASKIAAKATPEFVSKAAAKVAEKASTMKKNLIKSKNRAVFNVLYNADRPSVQFALKKAAKAAKVMSSVKTAVSNKLAKVSLPKVSLPKVSLPKVSLPKIPQALKSNKYVVAAGVAAGLAAGLVGVEATSKKES